MTTSKTQIKKKRGRPPLSAAKKMQRNKAAQNARAVHKALRTKIALLKADFKERLRVATQEAYQKALEKVVKIERKKMEANYKALAVAKAKFGKKLAKASQRMMMTGRRAKSSPQATAAAKKGTGMRKRGRPRKMK
jgi:cysteine sulfinate desulfinase/cysteine desulfurase-like protein